MKSPIVIALIFNGLDLITGVIYAVKTKSIQSSKLRDGLFKKAGFIICYFCGWLLDNYGSSIGFQLSVDILPAVILYVCTTELISILENVCQINPDIMPEKLMSLFKINDNHEEGKK